MKHRPLLPHHRLKISTMKNALIAIGIVVALLGAVALAASFGLLSAVQTVGAAHPGDTAMPTTQSAAWPAVTNERAATDGRMTVKSPSYACDSRYEASMFVLMSKGEQYTGASDVAAMFDSDVKQGSCVRLYTGDVIAPMSDPQVSDKDLSTVTINGGDREYFTPTHLLTHLVGSPLPASLITTAPKAEPGAAPSATAACNATADRYDDAPPVIKQEILNQCAAEAANVRGTINRQVEACQSHGGDCYTLQVGTQVIVDVPSSDKTQVWFELVSPANDQTKALISADSDAVTLN